MLILFRRAFSLALTVGALSLVGCAVHQSAAGNLPHVSQGYDAKQAAVEQAREMDQRVMNSLPSGTAVYREHSVQIVTSGRVYLFSGVTLRRGAAGYTIAYAGKTFHFPLSATITENDGAAYFVPPGTKIPSLLDGRQPDAIVRH